MASICGPLSIYKPCTNHAHISRLRNRQNIVQSILINKSVTFWKPLRISLLYSTKLQTYFLLWKSFVINSYIISLTCLKLFLLRLGRGTWASVSTVGRRDSWIHESFQRRIKQKHKNIKCDKVIACHRSFGENLERVEASSHDSVLYAFYSKWFCPDFLVPLIPLMRLEDVRRGHQIGDNDIIQEELTQFCYRLEHVLFSLKEIKAFDDWVMRKVRVHKKRK